MELAFLIFGHISQCPIKYAKQILSDVISQFYIITYSTLNPDISDLYCNVPKKFLIHLKLFWIICTHCF